MHIRPFFHEQQLPLSLFSLGPRRQRVARHKHVRPWRSGSSILLLGKIAMNADDINSCTLECAVREVLNAIQCLRSGNTPTDHSNVGVVQANSELQVIGDITEPGFTRRDRPDSAEGLILKVNTLIKVNSWSC